MKDNYWRKNMERFDFEKAGGKKIVKHVLKKGEPHVIIAKGAECAIIIPYNNHYSELVEMHPRILHGQLKDAENDVSIGMGALQISGTKEQDSMVFIDEKGTEVLALVGIQRYCDFTGEEI